MEYGGIKKDLKSSEIVRSVSVQCTNDNDELRSKYPHFMKATVNLKRLTALDIVLWTQKPQGSVKPTKNDVEPTSEKGTNDCEIVQKSIEKVCLKRRSDDKPKKYFTRSKKQKLGNETFIKKIAVESLAKPIVSKRKRGDDENNLESPSAKKTKLSENDTSNKSDGTSNESKATTTVCTMQFQVGDVIWGKIRGWPHWPCKILEMDARRIRYKVWWFNDYRTTNLYRSQIYKFPGCFDIFAEKFDTTVGLKDAVKEAMTLMFEQKRNRQ